MDPGVLHLVMPSSGRSRCKLVSNSAAAPYPIHVLLDGKPIPNAGFSPGNMVIGAGVAFPHPTGSARSIALWHHPSRALCTVGLLIPIP
jgi:hypothetical protein